jgi:non-specific serine/threonine protein kinase/serine/threonine-protein kinase
MFVARFPRINQSARLTPHGIPYRWLRAVHDESGHLSPRNANSPREIHDVSSRPPSIDPDRWRRIEKVLDEALELPPEAVSEFLDRACAGDDDLRAHVDRLLRADRRAGGFLSRPAMDGATEPQPTGGPSLGGGGEGLLLPVGAIISRYRIESILGQGGMGAVYLARQEKPDRAVAIKVIRAGLATSSMLRRFEQEAEVLGRLQHPGIAQIYEAGTADTGFGPQPFFAMELVRGVSLTEFARQHGLGTRERLDLVAKICDAVEHAHQKGVIHRDLKPSNILVTEEGQSKVLDFGVARATDSDVQQTTLRTDVGALVGTLPYMSPEQVTGDPTELDTRSDVYALGVITFELLTGRLPYSLERRMIHEAVRIIREDDPTPISSLDKKLRGDVETIVAHAMEKDKTRRYQAASALAQDVRRYLANEPIAAHPASTWYQLSKFSRRNKALVGGVLASFIILLVGLTVSLFAFHQVRIAQRLEKQRADELDQVARFQAAQFEEVDPQLMGLRMRKDIVADVVRSLELSGLAPQEVERTRTDLETMLVRGNATDIAVKTLKDNFLDRALKAVDTQFPERSLLRARLLQTLSDTFGSVGLYEEATAPQREALEIRRESLGPKHPETLESMTAMGFLLYRQNKTAEGEPMVRAAVEDARRVLGDEHPQTLDSMLKLGLILQDQDKFEEAEQFDREAVEGMGRVLGEDDRQTLIAKNNLGYLLRTRGKYAEAESLLRASLDGFRRLGDKDDPELVYPLNNLGLVLRESGKGTESEEYSLEAFALAQRVLGEDHPFTLTTLENLGNLYDDRSSFAEARPYRQLALETAIRVLGDQHPKTYTERWYMGEHLLSQDSLAQAEPYIREALEFRRRAFGEEEIVTAYLYDALSRLCQRQGKFAEAETCCRKAVSVAQKKFGDDHMTTFNLAISLGDVLRERGNYAEAESVLSQALRGSRRIGGDQHQTT